MACCMHSRVSSTSFASRSPGEDASDDSSCARSRSSVDVVLEGGAGALTGAGLGAVGRLATPWPFFSGIFAAWLGRVGGLDGLGIVDVQLFKIKG